MGTVFNDFSVIESNAEVASSKIQTGEFFSMALAIAIRGVGQYGWIWAIRQLKRCLRFTHNFIAMILSIDI